MEYWIKDIRDKNTIAYDQFVEGEIFNLHWPGSGDKSVKESEKINTDDIVFLKQNKMITHVVKMIDPTTRTDPGRKDFSIYRIVYCIKRYRDLKVQDVLGKSNYDQGNARKINLENESIRSLLDISISDLHKSTHFLDYSEREFPEGSKSYRVHQTIERNQSLVNEKKKNFLRRNNKLFCEICRFDFEDKYGEIGQGFIEAHHLIPISNKISISGNTEEDLILVCSNCHRMIHRLKPFSSQLCDIRERLGKNHLW